MIELKKFIFGPFSENTYLLYDKHSRESIVIDPGNMDPSEDNIILDFIENNSLSLNKIVLTHSHIDHMLGVNCLKDKYNPELIAPEKDMPLMLNADQQATLFGIEFEKVPGPDRFLDEELEIKIGNQKGRALFTPGHTPGEHCIYFETLGMLFSGDLLFLESIGRTDLWGGNLETLLTSISEKLLNLPDNVIVYPGHGEETSIGHEKRNNPFLKQSYS